MSATTEAVEGQQIRYTRHVTLRRRIPYLFVAFLLTALLLMPFLSVLAYEVYFMQRIHPGVSVGGIDLTGLGRAEAKDLLDREFQNYGERHIELRFENRMWRVLPSELGITYDANITSESAYRVGREGDVLGQLEVQAESIWRGFSIVASRRFDEGVATMFLSRMAREIDQPSRDPKLRIDGFHVSVQPGQPGRELDIPATKVALKAALESLSDAQVDLVVRPIEPTEMDLETARQQAENILSGPIIFTHREQNIAAGSMAPQIVEKRWSLDQATLAGAMIPRQRKLPDGRIALETGIDTEKLAPHVQRLAALISRPSRDAKFDFDPKAGKLSALTPSQEGYSLDVKKTLAMVDEQAATPNHVIQLPVEVTRPAVAVENAEQMGIKELVVEATTSFKGSPPARVFNIQLAASHFNNVVVAPGEVFSFNKYLGEVSAATGYQEGLIIWGDRTATGWGGGVCQVSTTAFRAAFWGGLPILERVNHGYRVSWYEPPVGLDATVFAPTVDFKFKNDMSHYILIKTETNPEAATITFRFYGTSQGRVVEMTGPTQANPVKAGPAVYQDDAKLAKGTVKQVEFPHDGVDVTILRTVREGRQTILEDRFVSHYQPWPAMYLRGAGGANASALAAPQKDH
jgi:vancomycin resistance protein YoaR